MSFHMYGSMQPLHSFTAFWSPAFLGRLLTPFLRHWILEPGLLIFSSSILASGLSLTTEYSCPLVFFRQVRLLMVSGINAPPPVFWYIYNLNTQLHLTIYPPPSTPAWLSTSSCSCSLSLNSSTYLVRSQVFVEKDCHSLCCCSISY